MSFTGFGKFSTAHRAARQGVNPRNPSQKVHDSRSDRSAVPGGQHPQAGAERLESFGDRAPGVPRPSLFAAPRASSRSGSEAPGAWPRRSQPPRSRRDGVRRPARRGGRAQAQPARRRARPAAGSAAGRAPRRRASGDAAAEACRPLLPRRSSTPSRRTRSRSSRSSRSSRRSAPTACARSRRSAPTRAPAGLLVIADGKRGDIGSTARAYAAAYLEPRGGARRRRRRAHRQPVPRPRLARAVPRRLPARRAPGSSAW